MPEVVGTVTAKSEYGLKLDSNEDWWNWSKPEYRGEPFQTDVKKGDTVKVTYAEADNGKVYISAIEVLGQSQDVTPDATESPGEARDGQFRSPLDFRRTSALAQAVAYYTGAPDPSADEVIKTAARFEKYLEGGYEYKG